LSGASLQHRSVHPSHLQFYAGLDPFVEQGAIIFIDPDTELHSCKGFRLFSSEKGGRDRLETNQMRAKQNVRDLIEYGSIDTGGLRKFAHRRRCFRQDRSQGAKRAGCGHRHRPWLASLITLSARGGGLVFAGSEQVWVDN
jgi:hypothetical protein